MERDHDVGQAADVRTRLLGAPWWVLAIVTGIPFCAVMVVTNLLEGGSVVGALVGAAVGSIVFGGLMGLFLARAHRRIRAVVGAVPPGREAAVHRSAARGPVPDDPVERAAAARLVAHNLDQAKGNLWWSLVVFAIALLLSAWLALTSSPWWWGTVVLWCGLIGWSVVLPSRLRRRLALLAA
jgi:hypothetical protein